MSEEKAGKGWWTPIKVGIALTAVVVVCFTIILITVNCTLLDAGVLECRRNIFWLLDSRPNEIGDALAGFAGMLAFIWIVVTVWLQSTELAEQRQVLIAQKEEFKLMVSAQNAQVKALEAQAEIFRSEMKQRVEVENDKLIDEAIISLVDIISDEGLRDCTWYFSPVDDYKSSRFYPLDAPRGKFVSIVGYCPDISKSTDRDIRGAIRGLVDIADVIDQLMGAYSYKFLPARVDGVAHIIRVIGVINQALERCSPSMRERAVRLGFPLSTESLKKLEADPKYWRDEVMK